MNMSNLNEEAAPVTSGDLSQQASDDQAFDDAQVHECNKILMYMRLIRKTDELDMSIALALGSITRDPPKMGVTEYTLDNVFDIIHSLPPVEEVNKPDFFNRKSLPFRLLRRILELHLVNLINPSDVSAVPLSIDDREDPRIFEHTWFLLFIGSSPNAIAENLYRLRDN